MFSSEQLDELIKKLNQQLSKQDPANKKEDFYQTDTSRTSLTTTQILIILALLSGTLEATSILIDRNQRVQIYLTGDLSKNEETEMDRVMAQISNMPFDEVMKAMFGRFK